MDDKAFCSANTDTRAGFEERTNYAQQTSLHAACDGNHANIVVDLLAAGPVARES